MLGFTSGGGAGAVVPPPAPPPYSLPPAPTSLAMPPPPPGYAGPTVQTYTLPPEYDPTNPWWTREVQTPMPGPMMPYPNYYPPPVYDPAKPVPGLPSFLSVVWKYGDQFGVEQYEDGSRVIVVPWRLHPGPYGEGTAQTYLSGLFGSGPSVDPGTIMDVPPLAPPIPRPPATLTPSRYYGTDPYFVPIPRSDTWMPSGNPY